MRRADKAVNDLQTLEEILRQGRICQLAIAYTPTPYIVTLNYGYRDGLLYFHSAAEGHKIDLLRTNPQVSFTVAIDLGLVTEQQACDWGARYRSVVGRGRVEFIEGYEAKRRALDLIMAQYSQGEFSYAEQMLRKTCLYRLVIEEMSGKQAHISAP